MVGREDGDDRVRVERGERGHREPDRRGVAARIGLDHDVVGPQLRQLLVDQRAVLGRRDHKDPLVRDDLGDAVDRVLKKGALAHQIEELLWPVPAGPRPEPRSCAP